MAATVCLECLLWEASWVHKEIPRVLILTCSGGSGLLQAAIAKEQEIQRQDPATHFVRRDMLKDWFWKFIGQYSIQKWDRAQRIGDVKTLEWLIARQSLADLFFWPLIFYRALTTFFREKIDRMIDTQPLGTSAVLLALRLYNWKSGKKIVLEKVAVDLPTERNTHIFRPIKKLSSKSKKNLRLITLPPLPDSSTQTPQEFWRKHCGLEQDEVVYEYYPVRQSFRKFQKMERDEQPFRFEARFSNAEEGELLSKAIRHRSIDAKMGESHVRFSIGCKDRVITLLLGSQPAFAATLGYVREMQRMTQNFGAEIHLFVLCAKHVPGKDSLLKQVAALSGLSKLNVIPLSFQNDEVIAPLFFRSDLTCTRSGGHTAMELMCTMKGEIWIHSESKKQQGELALEELLRGIPGWEAGNALYMHKFHNAKIVTPEQCATHLQRVLELWQE